MSDKLNNDEDKNSELHRLSLRGLHFPSDRLTIAMVRAKCPDLFDVGFGEGDTSQPRYFLDSVHAEEELGNMLYCERIVAASAYAKGRGIQGPRILDLDAIKDDLIDYYRKFGLVSGINAGSELIREIERQGQELAQQKGR